MEETLSQLSFAFLLLWGLVLVATLFRHMVPGVRDVFVPVSLVAGFLGLLLGPQVLGNLFEALGFTKLSGGLIPDRVLDVWKELPGLFITVIFASLFLGKPIPRVRTMWQQAGPQIMLGHSLAWGQYVVGIALTLFLLTPFWDAHPATGTLLEISFVGGHGTVAGMSDAFTELGFEEAVDIGMGLATVGVIAGAVLGTILVNWATRKKIINLKKEDESEIGADKEPEPKKAQWLRTFSVHLALIGVAIVIGWLLQQLFIWAEENTWGDRIELFRYMPLFPLAMIGALIVQVSLDRFGLGETLDRKLVNRISAGSLDILITSALATLSLAAIGGFLVPFILLALAAITWNVVGFLYLAPRMIPKHWFERGAGDFGQSIGMAALGLLLIQLADPQNRSGAKQRFGYKQVLFEPVVGGGLFTAASAPLIVQVGSVWVLIGTFILTAAFIAGGLWLFRQNNGG